VAGCAADRALDSHIAGPIDQVKETPRALREMNDATERAIDYQVTRSTPMTTKS
jgi:hypothetical protein